MGITKELFIECVEALQKQSEIDEKCNKAFDIILPYDFTSGYSNDTLSNMIIKMLKELTGDEFDIEYFIYEIDYGREYKKGCVTDEGKNINISTSEKLWKYLNKKNG